MTKALTYRIICLFTLCLIALNTLIAQDNDKGTPAIPQASQIHSPKKAAIMSACLPGLGQIYNKKWWKVPIVYAGLGGIGYGIYNNYTGYINYLDAYKIATGDFPEDETPSATAAQLAQNYSASSLQTYKESYRRDFEFYCILMAAWYGLNIIDAVVDAHLFDYDISDDLSLSVTPYVNTEIGPVMPLPINRHAGLCFKLKF